MSAVALELPFNWDPAEARETVSASGGVGGEPSLDSVLSGMWEGLAAHRSVICPLCEGEVRPDYGVHALPIGGRCQSCESRLS